MHGFCFAETDLFDPSLVTDRTLMVNQYAVIILPHSYYGIVGNWKLHNDKQTEVETLEKKKYKRNMDWRTEAIEIQY